MCDGLQIRLYEEATKTLLRTMTSGAGGGKAAKPAPGSGSASGAGAGHSNRVYCVKFRPGDTHTLMSGGWDNTIQIWDTRVGTSVRSIYGPHICGKT
jgi:COMPASS component SWD3